MATHASRNTTTGTKYEQIISTFLAETKIKNFHEQVIVGEKRNGGIHVVDILLGGEVKYYPKKKRPVSLHRGGTLVSLKNQNVTGTAEEKIPFECIKLQDAINDYGYDCGFIVLNGSGWSWKNEYLSDRFLKRIKLMCPDVILMSHDNFIKLYM